MNDQQYYIIMNADGQHVCTSSLGGLMKAVQAKYDSISEAKQAAQYLAEHGQAHCYTVAAVTPLIKVSRTVVFSNLTIEEE